MTEKSPADEMETYQFSLELAASRETWIMLTKSDDLV